MNHINLRKSVVSASSACHILLFAALFLTACTQSIKIDRHIDTQPPLLLDYAGVTMPPNIAPPCFALPDSCHSTRLRAVINNGTDSLILTGKTQVTIPIKQWKMIISPLSTGEGQGERLLTVTLQSRQNGAWLQYAPFQIHIAPERIDPYIAYRLIEPGYETWNEMGIYQRCLETYDESPILTNRMTGYGCMNCHNFCRHDPKTMLFHLRSDYGGTYVVQQGIVKKLNTKTPQTLSALVYPAWHPSGDFVAFSVNNTKQMFHTTDRNRVEVMDYASDVVIYDVRSEEIFTCPQLTSSAAFETFPAFSPDGRTLYFCTADSVLIPDHYDQVRYRLCSIPFNPDTRTFGLQVDTLVNFFHPNVGTHPGASYAETNRNGSSRSKLRTHHNASLQDASSVTFPRISPDGRHLVFTRSAYGNFTIWHRDADLYILDLQTREVRPMDELNSPDVESYHAWSSNSRWLIVSSRRMDGLYTRPFIAYIDSTGRARKPFPLPQRRADHYQTLLKSFNVPEFVSGKVEVTPYQFSQAAKTNPAIPLTFQEQFSSDK